MGPYRVNAIRGGVQAGYTATLGSHNLIVENIMMNDDRNGSNYRCAIVPSTGTFTFENIVQGKDSTILYVAGEYFRHMYILYFLDYYPCGIVILWH